MLQTTGVLKFQIEYKSKTIAIKLISRPFQGSSAAKEPNPIYDASVKQHDAQPENKIPKADASDVEPTAEAS